MKTCNCTLPYTNPRACEYCSNNVDNLSGVEALWTVKNWELPDFFTVKTTNDDELMVLNDLKVNKSNIKAQKQVIKNAKLLLRELKAERLKLKKALNTL